MKLIFILIAATFLLLVTLNFLASSPSSSPNQADSPIISNVFVDELQVLKLETVPPQVNLVVRGRLTDSCSTIDQINQQRFGHAIDISITSYKPADAVCNPGEQPFEEYILLQDLTSDTFTVSIGSQTTTFELEETLFPPSTATDSAQLSD